MNKEIGHKLNRKCHRFIFISSFNRGLSEFDLFPKKTTVLMFCLVSPLCVIIPYDFSFSSGTQGKKGTMDFF